MNLQAKFYFDRTAGTWSKIWETAFFMVFHFLAVSIHKIAILGLRDQILNKWGKPHLRNPNVNLHAKFYFNRTTGSLSKIRATEFLMVFHYFSKFQNVTSIIWGFKIKFRKNKEKPIWGILIRTHIPNFIQIRWQEVGQKSGQLTALISYGVSIILAKSKTKNRNFGTPRPNFEILKKNPSGES